MEREKYTRVSNALRVINLEFMEIWKRREGEEVVNQIMDIKRTHGNRIHEIAYKVNAGLKPRVNKKEPEVYSIFLNNYKAWFKKNVDEVVLVEEPIYNDKYQYTGHPDLIFKPVGKNYNVLIDYKSGVKLFLTGLQMSAYKEAWQEMTGEKIKHYYPLYITKKGEIKAGKIYTNHNEIYRMFLYALSLKRGLKNIY